jgi:hypothetical protein
LLAGARYFYQIIHNYGFAVGNGAAGAYKGGPGAGNNNFTPEMDNYEDRFNAKNAQLQKMIDCMNGGH